jgi:hypothetical protein
MTTILQIQETMKENPTNDYFFNYILGEIIDVINPNFLEEFGRFILFNKDLKVIATNQLDHIKICLYVVISRILCMVIYSFILVKDNDEFKEILNNPKLSNIDWDYVKCRCFDAYKQYGNFLNEALKLLDEKGVLLFNRDKRKLFKNNKMFEEVSFQMPIPEELKTDNVDLYNTKECLSTQGI